MPWGRRPEDVLRDRDSVDGRDFVTRARRLGIDPLLTPVRAPRASAVAERVIRTLRPECLDHGLLRNERHLEPVLAEYARFDKTERPHRSPGLTPPLPATGGPGARPDVWSLTQS
jgi:transposase InsO family protein